MDIIDTYRATTGVNFSTLKKYLKTPAHFKWTVEHPDEKEETDALVFGSALHCYVLEESEFFKRYACLDVSQRPVPDKDFKNATNRQWKKDMMASFELEKKRVITQDKFEEIKTLAANLKSNRASMNLLQGCVKETIVEWVDEESGVPCKALVDFYDKDRVLKIHGDLKSMKDASPHGVSFFMAKYYVYVQLAFYGDGLSKMLNTKFDCPFIIACEKEAPFLVQPYFINEKAIELGRSIYKSLLNVHRQCTEAKKWGGYEQFNEQIEGVIPIDLPQWAYNKVEATQMLQDN